MAKEEDSLSWWIDKGSDLAGQIVAGVTSASSNPVVGVSLGFTVTESLRTLGNEIRRWKLGPREERRIGAIFVYTTRALERRLRAGEELRSDGFFDLDPTGRSTSEEIGEAIVLAAEREHEERKIPHIGELYAFIATRADVDPGLANHLVRLAKNLSFRQYCILALPDSALRGELLPGHQTRQNRELSGQEYSALLEYQELREKGLIIFPNVMGQANLQPDKMRFYETQLFGIGRVLFEGLRLENIAPIDLRPTAKLLLSSAV